jgi:hypothetical protein
MKKAMLLLSVIATVGQSFAQGAYIEFKMTSADGVSGSTKVYTRDGSVRSVTDIASPQAPGGMHWVSLILKDNPNKSYQLNENAKTYSEIDLTKNFKKENDSSQFEVAIVGKEKVNGYNAMHIRVNKVNFPNVEDIWVSTDVPNYKQYLKVKSKYTTVGLFKAVAAKGVMGFPVRTIATERGKRIQIDVVKAEQRANDPALFTLSGNSAEADMMNKIKSMTPEERQKFIDELRKKQAEKKQGNN